MRRSLLLGATLCALATPAAAQAVTQLSANGSGQKSIINAQLVSLLQGGYEIKAAFSEAGVPYVLLQKQTSAYFCRGAGANTCEKLN